MPSTLRLPRTLGNPDGASFIQRTSPRLPRLHQHAFNEPVFPRHIPINIIMVSTRQIDLQPRILARLIAVCCKIIPKIQVSHHFRILQLIRVHMVRPRNVVTLHQTPPLYPPPPPKIAAPTPPRTERPRYSASRPSAPILSQRAAAANESVPPAATVSRPTSCAVIRSFARTQPTGQGTPRPCFINP